VPGSQELLVIALVALFVLGPERLPGLARSAARGLARLRNYGVTASKELRGVADLGEIEREVNDLRNELARTRADLRRAMRETIASSPSSRSGSQPGELPGQPPSAEAIGAVDALGVGGSAIDDAVQDGSDPDADASSARGA
jgi:sec-independent protein translocase protein TatB